MTILQPSVAKIAPTALRLAPALFAGTLLLSALLLFMVQPMFTKLVLPRLGGAPTVWSVAMVFFQAALLAGYAYAHLLIRRLPLGVGAFVHLGVLAAAALTLPIAITDALGPITLGPMPQSNVALWLIALFAFSIGVPFAALSASAPLLQGWFAASGHPQAGNPYVLYAASNLGSFAALIAYPILIEPLLPLNTQIKLWSVGFAVLAILIAGASLMVAQRPQLGLRDAPAAPVALRQRLAWLALAAIPSGLTIAVTSTISTDVVAAPFLWVVPLALYLLTFIAVFRDRPWIAPETVARLLPILVAPLSIGLLGGDRVFWLAMIVLNLVVFVLLALLCHGELYRRRPAPARLTEFYLLVSLGGVLGGAFAALIAPHVFNRVYEYPLLLLGGLLVLPGMFVAGPRRMLAEAAPVLALAALAVAVWTLLGARLPAAGELPFQAVLVALVAVMLLQRHRPARFLALVALAFVVTALWRPGFDRSEAFRSFFGVHQVIETADHRYRLLYHGTTLHGAERIDADAHDGARPEPLTYYYSGGPIAESIDAARTAHGGALRHVAVVGLGAGSLACHRRGAEDWTFFEIDPLVAEIARDPRYFNFISACNPALSIVLGDARLTLAASAQRYDLIILDAFSSDAIPVHLLTREAMASYLARLAPDGAVVLHISNRHMDLAPVVAALGAAEDLVAYLKEDTRPDVVPSDFKMNALVATLARRSADLGDLPTRPGWHRLAPDPRIAAFTDEYSNILGAILRKKLGQ
jgi:hypothetical protein